MIVGAEFGHDLPQIAVNLQVISKIFLRLIITIIAPLLFATIVVGIAGHANLKQVGRMGWKSLLYFEIVSTIALFIGLLSINISKAGVGVIIPHALSNANIPEMPPQSAQDIILHVFPENIAKAIFEGQVLQIVVFSILFGIAVALVKEKFRSPMVKFAESLSETMFKFTHADLLRSYIASAENDLRLGAHEAPPAIISVFIGSQLTRTLDEIEKSTKKGKLNSESDQEMNLNIPKIPEILLDNTDRNRTSPFAFTGNKFEFRAVGSSSSCAKPMLVLNLIMAEQLRKFRNEVDALLAKNVSKDDAIYRIIRKYITESKKIRFEGNSYGEEWIEEARSRGLSNITSTPKALDVMITPANFKLFSDHNVLNEREIRARYEIKLENYIKKIQIESRIIGDISTNHIIPIAIRYQNTLIENVRGLKEVLDTKTFVKLSNNQMQSIKEISEHISDIRTLVSEMTETRRKANLIEDASERANNYHDIVLSYFDKVRYHVDKLELLVDDELWPLPKYRELLFIR